MKALEEDIPGYQVRNIIDEADKDENGKIDFNEFLRVSVKFFLSIVFLLEGGGIRIGTAAKMCLVNYLKVLVLTLEPPWTPLTLLSLFEVISILAHFHLRVRLTDNILSLHSLEKIIVL